MNPNHFGLASRSHLEFNFTHSNQVLVDLGEALLVSVNQSLGKVGQMLVNLSQGATVVARQGDFFPQILGRMGALDSLDEQVDTTIIFSNSGVLAVGEWATGTIAKASDRVRMPAKVRLVGMGLANRCFEGAKLVIDYLPDHFIVLHGAVPIFCMDRG
jgi:hypothetical protein